MSIITIDGSCGGGAMLRVALGLSVYTKKPFVMNNIRASRPKSGLNWQHLHALNAAASLCHAQVRGNFVGATTVTFAPGPLSVHKLSVDIGTAGSATLLLQAVLVPLLCSSRPCSLEILGGTDVMWSIPADYLKSVLFGALSKYAYCDVLIARRGYFPKGNGRLVVKLKPKGLAPRIVLDKQGTLFKVRGVSHASSDLELSDVALRQAESARVFLSSLRVPVDIQCSYSQCDSSGSGITLWGVFGGDEGIDPVNPVIIGASCLGGVELRSEDVGRKAASRLVELVRSDCACDEHLADQLIVFLGLFGGSILTSCVTDHVRHNILVVEKFLDCSFVIDGNRISCQGIISRA